MKKVLLIDDDRGILTTVKIHLDDLGYETYCANSGALGLEFFNKFDPSVVLLDLRLPDMDGLDLLRKVLESERRVYVIIITAYASIDTAVQAIKEGAFDYLSKPFSPDQLTHVLGMVERLSSLESQIDSLKGVIREGEIITRNSRMRAILDSARQVADSDATVLISGESGTGKGVLARLIHAWSARNEKEFITVNCAGLQESLLESDLFGHVKGAFTGALRDKTGKLELADGGTVFLDEISELTPAIQAKFLHFLQYREFERLGQPKPVRVDVRVISATNRKLDEMVSGGQFRQDLFFRLNVVEIHIPPLRERPEDIELIVDRYLKRFARVSGKPVKEFSEEAALLLNSYPWPGNVRELINVVERCTILSLHKVISAGDLPASLGESNPQAPGSVELKSLSDLEKEHIRLVLARSKSLEEAAGILGIDPATLWRKRKRYHLV